MTKFINTVLESESESEYDIELERRPGGYFDDFGQAKLLFGWLLLG